MTRRDPSKFESSVRRPDDFGDYWRQTETETLAVPLNPRLEPVPMRSTPEVEVFEARYDSYGGLEIAGWYCRPRNIAGPLPGYLFVPGYVSEPKLPTDLAMMGYAAFSAAPRNKLRSNSVFNPGYPGLLVHNLDKRTEYGYRGFYTGCDPSVRLSERPRRGRFITHLRSRWESRRCFDAPGVGVAGWASGMCFRRRSVSMLYDGCGIADTLVPVRGDQRLPASPSRARRRC